MSPLRIAVAVLVATSVLGGMHYYFYLRWVRDTALPEPYDSIGRWVFFALAAMIVLGIALRRVTREVSTPVAWVVYTWLGLAFLSFFLWLAADAGRLAWSAAERIASSNPPDPERRLILARVLAAAVGVGAFGLGALGIFNVVREVAVKRVRVPLAKLPSSASGYRIALITDVHVGPTIGQEFLERIVHAVNALEADMIAITGDLVDGSVADLGPLVSPLKDLRAKDGVFFVTGNHEYYSGVDEWLAFLPTLGIRVLLNERVSIGGEEGFDLAGVEDLAARGVNGHAPDLARAVAGRDDSRALVLLAHQPKAIREAAQHGVDLQLSGHTHGGQLFPWKYFVGLDQPYVAGLHTHGRSQVYVSSGTGYWGPPMRVGAPAEITDIELVRLA
jgi:uncharacterized protein